MNPDDLDVLWRSPHNAPSPSRLDNDQARFRTARQRRDRGFRVGMALVVAWLTLVTGRLLWRAGWPAPGREPIDFTREWAVVLFLVLPWAGAILLIYRDRKRRARHPDPDRSIVDSLRALIDQCRAAEARVRTILWLHTLGVPLLALGIRQIIHAGKARPNEVASMIVFFSGIITLSVGCLALEWWRQRRETRRLERVLRDYEMGGEA